MATNALSDQCRGFITRGFRRCEAANERRICKPTAPKPQRAERAIFNSTMSYGVFVAAPTKLDSWHNGCFGCVTLTDPAEALNGQRRPPLTWFLTGISVYSLTHSVFSSHVNNRQVFGLLPLRAFFIGCGSWSAELAGTSSSTKQPARPLATTGRFHPSSLIVTTDTAGTSRHVVMAVGLAHRQIF